MFQVKVTAAKQELIDVTREHTARLRSLNHLLTEKVQLEDKLNARQRKMVICVCVCAPKLLPRSCIHLESASILHSDISSR